MNKSPASATKEWDLVIRPKVGWLDLHLADLWRYRDLTAMFVWRDFVAQYKQTILGPLWHILQPLFTTLIFTVVFGKMAKLSTDGVPPLLFYLAGVTCWSYFADCVNRTSVTFISNAAIFGKVYFPRLSVPLSLVISSMIKFAIQLALFLAFLIFYWMQGAPVQPTAAIALTPLLLLLMAGLSLGAGIIVSAFTTRYRDLQQLVAFGVQLMMFATPVVYPLSMIGGGSFRWLILANPMTPIVETFRYAYLGSGTFDGHVSLLQRRLHSGGSVYRRCSFQPRRAYLHGHSLGQGKAESGKWKVESGKRKVESGKWKVESGKAESRKQKAESGKWKVESGKWKRKAWGKTKVEMREGRLTDEFRARTKKFAAFIIRFYVQLPKERDEVQVCARQMLRSGTSVAAHTREAARARSDAEFVSKLGGRAPGSG